MHVITELFSRLHSFFPVLTLVAMLIFAAGTGSVQAKQSDGPAAPTQQSGFIGPYVDPITVEEAKQLSDDDKVALRGSIVQGLGGEHFIFRDSTGEINIEISDKDWRGQQISPEDTVDIYGEVEKDWGEPIKIDVDQIVKR